MHPDPIAQQLASLRLGPPSPPPSRPFPTARREWLMLATGVVVGGVVAVGLLTSRYAAVNPPAVPAVGTTSQDPALVAGNQALGEGRALRAVGYVITHARVEVSAGTGGRVRALHVEVGDRVRRGEVIAEIENPQLEIELSHARGALQHAQATHRELLAGSLPEAVRAAQAEVEQGQARLRGARGVFQRTTILYDQGLISAQEMETARADFELREGELSAATHRSEMVRAGPRQGAVDASEADVLQAEAMVRLCQVQLDEAIVRAPLSGVVTERLVEVGEMVGSGWNGAPNGKAGLVRIARLDDLRVEVDVHQSDISTIRLDDSAIATLAGTPPRSFACRVLRVDPQANRQQGTIRVELLVISPDSALTPNANVSVVFSRR